MRGPRLKTCANRWTLCHHLRRFRVQHAQVSVLRPDRMKLTDEAQEWLGFVREVFAQIRSTLVAEWGKQ